METAIVKLSLDEAETVYEPSEDSFLLIDALEADLERIKAIKPTLCLEIGCGSGVIVTSLAIALKTHFSAYCIGSDMNPRACEVTKKTSVSNSTNVEVIQMDLASNFCARDIFDIILFNPPYVVTESLEIFDDRLISKAWAGGNNGREVMDRLFKHIPQLLSKHGLFYLLVIKENDPQNIIDLFKSYGMKGSIIAERKIRGEHLHILRFSKEFIDCS